jgi:hypothetical protein
MVGGREGEREGGREGGGLTLPPSCASTAEALSLLNWTRSTCEKRREGGREGGRHTLIQTTNHYLTPLLPARPPSLPPSLPPSCLPRS